MERHIVSLTWTKWAEGHSDIVQSAQGQMVTGVDVVRAAVDELRLTNRSDV